MLQCWAHMPDQRPNFKTIVEYLRNISNNKRVYVDFNQLNPSYSFPPTYQQQKDEDVKIDSLGLQGVTTIEVI